MRHWVGTVALGMRLGMQCSATKRCRGRPAWARLSGTVYRSGGFKRVVEIFLTTCLSSAVTQVGTAAAVALGITNYARSVTVYWPTNAAGFNLEFAGGLGVSNTWFTAFPAPATAAGLNLFSNAAASAVRFYRLRQAGSAAPVLTNLQAPGSMAYNGTGVVSFHALREDSQ